MAIIPNFPRVHFDYGAVDALGGELARLGVSRPLLMTDAGLVACGTFAKVENAVPDGADAAVFDATPENPTVAGVDAALKAYRAHDCDGVVSVGGGSVIDSAKAVATLARNPGPLSRYGRPDPEPVTDTAPHIAIPTTAGTGSEVTRGAGIHPDDVSRSSGIGGDYVLPDAAICDPELTLTLPPGLTAGTGMDALSHCLEGYLSTAVNPPVEAIALDGIGRVVSYIERAVADGGDREARWHMSMAALQGGMAISMGLGTVHAMGNTFGDWGLHHGVLVTISMPAVVRFVEDHVGDKMNGLRHAMNLPADGDVADAITDLNARLGLPSSLRDMEYPKNDLEDMAADVADSFFNASSPRPPTHDEAMALVIETLG